MLTFGAALFDMDGTILDSMGVWADVDRHFFESRNMPVPEDYAHSISGLSFRQTAVYTKERFNLAESVDEILDEWNKMCEDEYVNHVVLKENAKEYLMKLKGMGVKLAVATALPERLFRPALERNGIYHLFDAYASTDEAGERKSTGKVYLLAAERLGVDRKDCCVFEDILDGIQGAKNVGMKAVLVRDDASIKTRKESLEIADAYLEAYAQWL